MTYKRVLPRDLFNEANLLKCLGKLTMDIEDGKIDWVQYHYDSEAFEIRQNESNGALYVTNIQFWTKGLERNEQLYFERPLNSRDSWPLFLETENDSYPVFDDQGNFVLTKEQFLEV